jgi:1,4-dihydroxy-2-naphthoate octaprenyltransferase
LLFAGGWLVVVIGLLSLLLGYSYSMGPLPLSHTPLGEVIVIAFFGIVAVMGTAHVLGALPTGQGFLAGVMMGLPSGAVLLLNNHRDRKTDAAAGRRTLAILAGETGARVLYTGLVLTSVILLPFVGNSSMLLVLLESALILAAALLAAGRVAHARISRDQPLPAVDGAAAVRPACGAGPVRVPRRR